MHYRGRQASSVLKFSGRNLPEETGRGLGARSVGRPVVWAVVLDNGEGNRWAAAVLLIPGGVPAECLSGLRCRPGAYSGRASRAGFSRLWT